MWEYSTRFNGGSINEEYQFMKKGKPYHILIIRYVANVMCDSPTS